MHEVRNTNLVMQRKFSLSTAATSSPVESSDEDMSSSDGPRSSSSTCRDSWCNRCVTLYRDFQNVAERSGFTLVGKLYSRKLAFKCEKNHLTKIRDCSKRLHQEVVNCADCRREEKEAVKREMMEDERRQQEIFAAKQEEMFRKARLQMENELNQPGAASYGA